MTATKKAPAVQKGRSTERNYEALPDCIWTPIGERQLFLTDVPLYIYDRRSWRPWHWDARVTHHGRQVADLLRPPGLIPDLFGLPRGKYREYTNRIAQAKSWAGNPFATYATIGAGRKCQQHVRLYSIYRTGTLLNKHLELSRGHYDAVHQGLFLPFGDIRQGRLVRFLAGPPLLTIDQAGLFLWLLNAANREALRHGFLDGEGFAQTHARVTRTRREVNSELRISIEGPAHEQDLQHLLKLGWIRLPDEPLATVDFLVAEAPADLLELLLLATVAHQNLPLARASGFLDEVSEGKHGILWVLDGLPPDIGLTPEGEELLRVEIWHRRLATTSYTAATPTIEAILDTIPALALPARDQTYLEDQVDFLVRAYGENRVWDAVWNAKIRRRALDNPVGWILSVLQAGPEQWALTPAPVQRRIDSSDQRFAYLFQKEEPPAEEPEE